METQKVLFEHRKKLFNYDGSLPLQVACWNFTVAILEDAPIPNGRGHKQPAQNDLALRGPLDQESSRGVFPSCLFCDFMILLCFEYLKHTHREEIDFSPLFFSSFMLLSLQNGWFCLWTFTPVAILFRNRVGPRCQIPTRQLFPVWLCWQFFFLKITMSTHLSRFFFFHFSFNRL